MTRGLLAVAALLLVAACSASAEDVDWSQFAPSLHGRIDLLAAASDCHGLQRQFDAATDSELMRYIDAQMRDVGCY